MNFLLLEFQIIHYAFRSVFRHFWRGFELEKFWLFQIHNQAIGDGFCTRGPFDLLGQRLFKNSEFLTQPNFQIQEGLCEKYGS